MEDGVLIGGTIVGQIGDLRTDAIKHGTLPPPSSYLFVLILEIGRSELHARRQPAVQEHCTEHIHSFRESSRIVRDAMEKGRIEFV